MRNLILIALLFNTLIASNIIMPIAKYKASGAVEEILLTKEKLYSATDKGIVDIFDIRSKKIIKKIQLPKIKDFMGDTVDPKVFSIDLSDTGLLILSQAEQGFSNLYIYRDNKLHPVLTVSDSLAIAKAKFLNKDTVILALLSSELISMNLHTKKENWHVQESGAKFSDFVLNEKKDELVLCDESGAIKICDTKNGKITQTLKGQNLDEVFQVDFKNGIIITAGKDRRAVVFALKFHSAYYKTSNFFIYSVGLSPSGKLAAYSSDENNNITLFDTITQKEIGVFGGNRMTLTNIVFYGEEKFFSSSYDKTINLYKIK